MFNFRTGDEALSAALIRGITYKLESLVGNEVIAEQGNESRLLRTLTIFEEECKDFCVNAIPLVYYASKACHASLEMWKNGELQVLRPSSNNLIPVDNNFSSAVSYSVILNFYFQII